MKVLQINTSINSSAPGRIASEIGDFLINMGHESFVGYGRICRKNESSPIKIGNKKDLLFHLITSRLLDIHGFSSKKATEAFVDNVKEINPDIIHLHNLHGYYIHIGVLFKYLKKAGKPVVWTFHDCWPFTGHCCYFDRVNCFKWQTECFDCPNTYGYPRSWVVDYSRENYRQKKVLFTGLENLVIVSPSEWLAGHLRNSFLSGYEIRVINNGIDLDKFRPVDSEAIRAMYNLNKKYILGVASIWTERKGLEDFKRLRKILDPEIEIVLVGLTRSQIKSLHVGMKGISRTESIDKLAALYSGAKAFINPTYIDNFPSVNIEALASGTPVITYNTGGSTEAIDIKTGRGVEKGNIRELHSSIMAVINTNDLYNTAQCCERAVRKFSAQERFGEYLNLYQELLT